MFPKGSPELVEPIYKNAVLSAPFNEQMAVAIHMQCLHMLQVCSSPYQRSRHMLASYMIGRNRLATIYKKCHGQHLPDLRY